MAHIKEGHHIVLASLARAAAVAINCSGSAASGGRSWKDVTLPLARHGGLFLPLIVLASTLAVALLLPNFHAVQPLTAAALRDTNR